MELEARLRAFAALARRRSFSRAAEELGIGQPAVSRHIAELEQRLGTHLIIRDRRGAQLTPAGELLANYVARAEALLAQADSGIGMMLNPEHGRLVIAASGTPGIYVLPPVIAAFHLTHPDVDLVIELATSSEVIARVQAHRAEIGLVGGLAAAPDLEAEPFLEDEIVIVGPAHHGARRWTPRELERLTWLSREEGSATAAAVEHAWNAIGLRPSRRVRLPDWEMLKRAVEAGMGVAAVSRLGVEAEVADGRLAILDAPGWHVVRPLSVVRPRDIPLMPLAEEFLAVIRATARDIPAGPTLHVRPPIRKPNACR